MFNSLETLQALLEEKGYIAGRNLATVLFLAYQMNKPLLLEGPAGVGKTEVAKVMAEIMDTELIRLQCYEGLDEQRALYEWNYQKQLLYLQTLKGENWEEVQEELFGTAFLLPRPLLKALTSEKGPVLLIDELDKSDAEFESFLLEELSDFQITIPEIGTIKAKEIPLVIITSNNERDFSDALKRRCIHFSLDFPDKATELAIVKRKIPYISEDLAFQIVDFVQTVRRQVLKKQPSIAETLDWAKALLTLKVENLTSETVEDTIFLLLKYKEDIQKVSSHFPRWVAKNVK